MFRARAGTKAALAGPQAASLPLSTCATMEPYPDLDRAFLSVLNTPSHPCPRARVTLVNVAPDGHVVKCNFWVEAHPRNVSLVTYLQLTKKVGIRMHCAGAAQGPGTSRSPPNAVPLQAKQVLGVCSDGHTTVAVRVEDRVYLFSQDGPAAPFRRVPVAINREAHGRHWATGESVQVDPEVLYL